MHAQNGRRTKEAPAQVPAGGEKAIKRLRRRRVGVVEERGAELAIRRIRRSQCPSPIPIRTSLEMAIRAVTAVRINHRNQTQTRSGAPTFLPSNLQGESS